MSPIIHSAYFRTYCHEKSLTLLDKATQTNQLPPRLAHPWLTIKAARIGAFLIVESIVMVAVDIFMLASSPFRTNKRLENAFYAACRLTVIEPLNILSCLAQTVLRVALSALGIFSPSIAVKGWQLAERLELFNLALDQKIIEKCGDFPPPSSHKKTEIRLIQPKTAISYLGSKLCLKLEHPEEINPLTTQIQTDFANYLEFLNAQDPEIIYKIFVLSPEDMQKLKTASKPSHDVLAAAQFSRTKSPTKIIDEVKQIFANPSHIRLVFRWIRNSVIHGHGFKQSNTQAAINLGNFLAGKTKIDPKQHEDHVNRLKISLAAGLKFGSVRVLIGW